MLKRVKIQGYKSLEDVEVHLQPLSVLFGPNASGKSNFLDALQLLSRIATNNNLNDAFRPPYRGTPLESFTFGPDGLKGLLAKERVSFTIEVDTEISQRTLDAIRKLTTQNKTNANHWNDIEGLQQTTWRYHISIECLPQSGALNIIEESLVKLDSEDQPTTQRIWIEGDRTDIQWKEGGVHFESEINHSILSLPYQIPITWLSPYWPLLAIHQELSNWFFYHLEPLDHMRTPSPLREVRHIGLRGEELDAFLNTLQNLDAPQFDAIEKALHVILPSFTGIDIKINTRGETELSLIEGQTPISVRLLSEGTLRILGLLAIVSTKKAPYLIGIEEPENSINANRLDLIALLLENRAIDDTQVLATTHSPTLIDFISDESLYFLRQSESNGNTTIKSLTDWKKRNLKPEAQRDFRERTSLSDRILRGDFNA